MTLTLAHDQERKKYFAYYVLIYLMVFYTKIYDFH